MGGFYILAFYQKITRRELKGEASLFCLIDLFAFFSSLFSLYNISTIYKCGEWEDEHNSKEVAQSQNLQQTLRFALLFSVTIFPFTFIFYYTSYRSGIQLLQLVVYLSDKTESLHERMKSLATAGKSCRTSKATERISMSPSTSLYTSTSS